MARAVTLGLAGFLVSCWAWPTLATTNYIYPLDSWRVTTTHGEELSDGLYHMGVDAGNELSAGAAVYATAPGIVREVQERTQFGLVVLIEHYVRSESTNVSLYGHLDPTNILVEVGQAVQAGDVIGVLGDETNNGGWKPHLHFGIHKEIYTGDWMYYGHVNNPSIAEDWEDPVTYIPEHLVRDSWSPTIELDITDGALVGDTADFNALVRDVGSLIKNVTYRISADDGVSWMTVLRMTDPSGNTTVQLPLYSYADGPLVLKIVARDHFNNKTVRLVQLIKNSSRYSSTAFLTMKAGNSNASIAQWSFGGVLLQTFLPFSDDWSDSGDIALGDVIGNGSQQIIAGRGTSRYLGKIKVFDQTGGLLSRFTLQQYGSIRLAAGDITGDGVSEIIIATGKRDVATVEARDYTGQLLWSVNPLGDKSAGSFDVVTGNIDDDLAEEVVAVTRAGLPTEAFILDQDGSALIHFFPFRKSFSGGANVTFGDVTGDGQNDLIFGSESRQIGTVKIFDTQRQEFISSFHPFGDEFFGSVDVAAVQWDTTEDEIAEDEIIVSQASAGQAWVKVYRLSAEPEILLTKRVYESEFQGGTRIVGYK